VSLFIRDESADIDAAKIADRGTVEVWVSGIQGGTNLGGPSGGWPSNKPHLRDQREPYCKA